MSSDTKPTQKYNDQTFREEIEVIFPKEKFEDNLKKALEIYKKSVKAPGFRKGHVPENVVLSQNFEDINNKALTLSIEDAVRSLGTLNPAPAEPLNVEKIEQQETGELKLLMTYYPMPEVEVGDLSNISVEKKDAQTATKEEVEKELQNLWFHYAQKTNPEVKKDDYKPENIDEKFLSESGLSNLYKDMKNIDDLRKHIEDHINQTYKTNSSMIWESDIQDKIIDSAKYTRVEGLIEKELNNRVADYKARFTQLGMNADEYLKESNVNLDELRKEWKPSAEKYVKLELALQKYGQQNNLLPTDEEIDSELSHLDENVKSRYKDNPETLRSLVKYYYVNQKSFSQIVAIAEDNLNSDKPKANKEKKAKK